MECWASDVGWSGLECSGDQVKERVFGSHLPMGFVPTFRRSKQLFKHYNCLWRDNSTLARHSRLDASLVIAPTRFPTEYFAYTC